MPVVKSEYSCPKCKQTTGKLNQIVANGGQLQCSGDGSHTWNDTMTFYNEKPTMDFKVAPATFLPQVNHTPVTVSVPIPVKDAFEKKFGERASATIASLIQVLVEGDVIIIPQTDIDRISSRLGQKPGSSGELFGMIFALGEQVNDAKMLADNAAKDLKAYEGMSPGRVVVDLGDVAGDATEKARAQNMPLKVWVESNLKNAISSNWF
jgi:hypothetical protein